MHILEDYSSNIDDDELILLTKYTIPFVDLENKNLNLNEKEVSNVLKLHDYLYHLTYFNENHNDDYNNNITEKEIIENVLVASFYSFLPIIMQIKNNVSIFMNDINIKKTLSVLDLSIKSIPSYSNEITKLSDDLISTINDPKFNTFNNENILNTSFRFLKMNYGEIIYNNDKGNDIIKSNKIDVNIFACNRPFNFKYETYYEVKINKIGSKNIFIGFIDSSQTTYEKAFGFGCLCCQNAFCRRSPILNNVYFNKSSDDVMKNEQHDANKMLIKEGDTIGCYYTPEYTYLTINGQLTQYRNSNKSLKSYIPLIIIDHDQVELEIVKNVSIVDKTNDQYDFLNINNLPKDFFNEKDIKSLKQIEFERYSWAGRFSNIYQNFLLIGSVFEINQIMYDDINIETIEYPKEFYKERVIIRDIIPFEDNQFVSKLIVEIQRNKQIVEIDSRSVSSLNTRHSRTNYNNTFHKMVENITGMVFQYDSTTELSCLPENLQKSSDLNSIKRYLTNKIIKDSTKSIAIIMTRYLAFILIDYLRYSKSKLLQDEGINSNEMNILIKALAYSLPTITQFTPSFDCTIDDKKLRQFTIFSDEQNETGIKDDNEDNENNNNIDINPNIANKLMNRFLYKSPGDSFMFNCSFKLFLKLSANFLSSQFLSKLMKESFEITKGNSLTSNDVYELIPSIDRFESISPLPDKIKLFNILFGKFEFDYDLAGLVPILLSSIPEQLPCVKFSDKKLRFSSDQVSYFDNTSLVPAFDQNGKMKWKYNVEKLQDKSPFDRNYKLQVGMFKLYNNLDEILLIGPLGFVQNVFNILQSLNDSKSNNNDSLYHELLEYSLYYSSIKDPIAYPFIEPIIISIIAICGFVNVFFGS